MAADPAPARSPRRSWYMPPEDADVLFAAVEDLHFRLRLPKHVILSAIMRTGLAHPDEVEAAAKSAEIPARRGRA